MLHSDQPVLSSHQHAAWVSHIGFQPADLAYKVVSRPAMWERSQSHTCRPCRAQFGSQEPQMPESNQSRDGLVVQSFLLLILILVFLYLHTRQADLMPTASWAAMPTEWAIFDRLVKSNDIEYQRKTYIAVVPSHSCNSTQKTSAHGSSASLHSLIGYSRWKAN